MHCLRGLKRALGPKDKRLLRVLVIKSLKAKPRRNKVRGRLLVDSVSRTITRELGHTRKWEGIVFKSKRGGHVFKLLLTKLKIDKKKKKRGKSLPTNEKSKMFMGGGKVEFSRRSKEKPEREISEKGRWRETAVRTKGNTKEFCLAD